MRRIGVVIAMDKEFEPIISKASTVERIKGRFDLKRIVLNSVEFYVLKSGVGEIAAASAVQHLIDLYNINTIVNFGVAGSLKKECRVGKMVVVSDVFHYEIDANQEILGAKESIGRYIELESKLIPLNRELIEVAKDLGGLECAVCASGNRFIIEQSERDKLASLTHADICEMEAAGIALTCLRNGVDALLIKAVSDSHDEDYFTFLESAINKLSDFFVPIMQRLTCSD